MILFHRLLYITLPMCIFCDDPTARHGNGDNSDMRFMGFFSSEAIESCIRVAKMSDDDGDGGGDSAGSGEGDGVDDDGT